MRSYKETQSGVCLHKGGEQCADEQWVLVHEQHNKKNPLALLCQKQARTTQQHYTGLR